ALCGQCRGPGGGLGRDQFHPDQRNPARVLADLDRCHLRPGLTVRRCRLRPSLALSIGNSRAHGASRRRTIPTSQVWPPVEGGWGRHAPLVAEDLGADPFHPPSVKDPADPSPWVPVRRRSVHGIVFAHGSGHGLCVTFPCPTPPSSPRPRGTPPR